MNVTKIAFKGIEIPVVKRYQDVGTGDPLAVVGSFDTLELSIREGSFSERYNVRHGMITLRWL